MARLPQPGGDSGTWGNVLNDYLSQTHKADGTLKDNSVTANTLAPDSVTNSAIASDAVNATSIADGSITNAQIADGTIQEIKLSSAVQAKLDNPTIADATNSVKGKVQLTGDLGGAAASPTVIGLQGRSINNSAPADGQVLSYSSAGSTWVPATVSSTTVTDATTGSKGIVQLAGDLAGTASSPTVPALANKLDTSVATSTYAPKASPTFTGTVTVPTPTNGTDATTKAYVDSAAASGTPDATNSVKGKVQLAGDLGGTAASPTVPGLAGKEPAITAGSTSQYYRGDKSWQTLDKTAVGLSNVDNTSDANKPVSTATQTALNLKVDTTGDQTITGIKTFSSSPVVPTPTTSSQAATKGYVDSVASGGTGLTRNTSTINSSVTLGATVLTDYIVYIDTSGVATLPTAVGNSNIYWLKNIAAVDRTVFTTLSQTIENSVTLTLMPGSAMTVNSDGSNWRII